MKQEIKEPPEYVRDDKLEWFWTLAAATAGLVSCCFTKYMKKRGLT